MAHTLALSKAMQFNDLTGITIGAAIEVHRCLGPGLLDSAYETCLEYELTLRGLHVERQKPLPIVYKEMVLDHGYRIDLLIENMLIVELESVEQLTDVHQAQILSYLRLSGCKIGLLLNFNVALLKNGGIKRYVL
jgi:GxxExxY protein